MNLPDGNYNADQLSIENSFTSEKEFCDFIERNIHEVLIDCLGFEVDSYRREFSIVPARRKIKGNRRVDFLVNTKCGKRLIIECKNPFYISEVSGAIGQCLTYLTLLRDRNLHVDFAVIMCTKMDLVTPAVIDEFKLPIKFVILDRSVSLTFSHHEPARG